MQVKVEYMDHYVGAGLHYKHSGDSGFDLRATELYLIAPGDRVLFHCGFKVEIPKYAEMQIRSRSSVAFKKGLVVINSPGTIDSGYRGEIKVPMINLTDKTVVVEKGERIAQGVMVPVYRPEFLTVDTLEDSDRGTGGFGSTGA